METGAERAVEVGLIFSWLIEGDEQTSLSLSPPPASPGVSMI